MDFDSWRELAIMCKLLEMEDSADKFFGKLFSKSKGMFKTEIKKKLGYSKKSGHSEEIVNKLIEQGVLIKEGRKKTSFGNTYNAYKKDSKVIIKTIKNNDAYKKLTSLRSQIERFQL